MSYYSEARAVFLDGFATERETAMRVVYDASTARGVPKAVLNQAVNLILGEENTFAEELAANP